METVNDPQDLLSLEPEPLRQVLRGHFDGRGQPAFRTKQVEVWILEQLAPDFEAMTNLPKEEREALGEVFFLGEGVLDTLSRSTDGTVKHLWRLADGELVESVLIPTPDRLTLCISSQAGCAMGCTFCATGFGGFRRSSTR